jgi:hypothetical protein
MRLVCAAVASTPMAASAALTIALNQTTISPAANQTVNIISTASGLDLTNGIKGVDLFVQIDNGGVDNGNSSNPVAPKITSINLSNGIFSANNDGFDSYYPSGNGLLAFNSISTSSGTVSVPANGVLGTITFNAAGVASGTTFELYFGNVGADDSDFSSGAGTGSNSDYTNSNNAPGSYSQSTTPPYSYGGPNYNPLVLAVTAASPTTAYWTGKSSTNYGNSANSWDYGLSLSTPSSNWSSDSAGANDTLAVPGSVTNVYFTATNANAPGGVLNTQLDANYTLNSLSFDTSKALNGGTGISKVSINTSIYTLALGAGGLTISANDTSTTTISGSGGVVLEQSQNWYQNAN